MILELELGAVIALLAVPLVRRKPATPAAAAAAAPAAAAPAPPAGNVEVLKKHAGGWHLIGHRHAGHSDIAEALRTPGLAVRDADGSFREGGVYC